MKSAESGVPASICRACSSVEGASTLSEVRVAGLYQYKFVSSFPKRTMPLMCPLLRATKRLPSQLRLNGVLGSSARMRRALEREEGYVVLLLPTSSSEAPELLLQRNSPSESSSPLLA